MVLCLNEAMCSFYVRFGITKKKYNHHHKSLESIYTGRKLMDGVSPHRQCATVATLGAGSRRSAEMVGPPWLRPAKKARRCFAAE
jgi:hypothetical protein